MISSENKLLLQSDVVFDSESNGRNLSSLAPTGGQKKSYLTVFILAVDISFKINVLIR